MTDVDPYDVLGVDPGDSASEVKAAFRRAARQWHPDKNSDPSALGRFRQARWAYEQLRQAATEEGVASDSVGNCPVCSTGPGSMPGSTRVSDRQFDRWLNSDDESDELWWIFDLCEPHYDLVMGLDEESLQRRVQRAETVMNTISTAHSISSFLENATWRVMQFLMLVMGIALLVGIVQSCS